MPQPLTPSEREALLLLATAGSKVDAWRDAGWVGVCPCGDVALCAVELDQLSCDRCGRRYRRAPRQDVVLAAFKLGGWDAMQTAAKGLADGEP